MDKATLEYDPPMNSEYFDNESIDLLKKLLIRDPEKRFGSGGAEEIKAHPWFSSIDWGM